MSIETTIYSVLSGDATVVALTTAARIKPPGDWQNLARPYITYRPITFDPTHVHNHESTALINHYPNFQINIVADTYASAREVADAVKTAIRGTANGLQGTWQFFLRNELPLDYDTDMKIMEIAQDYEVWGR